MITDDNRNQIVEELRRCAADTLDGLSFQRKLADITEASDTSWRGVMRRVAELVDCPNCGAEVKGDAYGGGPDTMESHSTLIDRPISAGASGAEVDEVGETEVTPREIAAELRHAANYGDSETLAGWWNRLQSAVLRDDDFPDPRETFRRLAELID